MAAMIRTLKNIYYGSREWYQENRSRQLRFWGLAGVMLGYPFGRIKREIRMRKCEFGDHMIITEYYIDRDRASEFEQLWTAHARLTQCFHGYIGTKLFKVLNKDWPEQDAHKIMLDESQKKLKVESSGETEEPIDVTAETRLPFQYLQLRGWLSPAAENEWLMDENVQMIVRNLEKACTKVIKTEYSTLANDQIRRQIF